MPRRIKRNKRRISVKRNRRLAAEVRLIAAKQRKETKCD